jgi:hypothetical protein
VYCAQCSEKIIGKPLRQDGDYFCSLECANIASGIDPEEHQGYYEEKSFDDFYEEAE